MTLIISTFSGGPVETNAYLILDADGNALLVDAPLGTTEAVVSGVRQVGARVQAIVVTHPHWDHFADAAELKVALAAPVIAHATAVPRLADPASSLFPLPEDAPVIAPVEADVLVGDGDVVTLGSVAFSVLFVPGHEPSHIALYQPEEKLLFGGDVIFPGGHGTLAIPGADPAEMQRTLRRLAALPDDVTVYPGHGAPTTIGAERSWLPTPE